MQKSLLVVVGSSNTDMVVMADHLPVAGETIMGGAFFMNPGGKGANQAVAAARLGGSVVFIAKTGEDIFGQQARAQLMREGIDLSHLLVDSSHPSGVALITIDKQGENCIVVAPGTNALLLPADLVHARSIIRQAAIVLLQLEIPADTVKYVVDTAAAAGVRVILNPAPAIRVAEDIISKVSIITPNETEAAILTGIAVTDFQSAEAAAKALHAKGIETVIITRGDRGALLLHKGNLVHVAAREVKQVDTTAAGDVFNGALAVALAEGRDMQRAVEFACAAAAISVTRFGAQASAPFRHEVLADN